MKSKLFLTGPGASCLIKEVMGYKLAEAGGLITKTLYDEEGRAVSRVLLPAAVAGGVEGFEPEPYLDLTKEPPEHDTEVFRTTGVRLIEEAAWYNFSLFDSLGGFELVVPQFRAALTEYLNGEQPCLGVLDTVRQAENTMRQVGLTDRYLANVQRLHEALSTDEDSMVIELKSMKSEIAKNILIAWKKEFS